MFCFCFLFVCSLQHKFKIGPVPWGAGCTDNDSGNGGGFVSDGNGRVERGKALIMTRMLQQKRNEQLRHSKEIYFLPH